MQDDQLLPDLRALKYAWFLEHADKLEQHGIQTYTQLLALLGDESADEALRTDACWYLSAVRKKLDGRQVIPILLKLYRIESQELRRAAIHTLGTFGSKRALDLLLQLLADPQASIHDRMDAVHALNNYEDERIATLYKRIMFDVNEDVRLRSLAIEWSPHADSLLDAWVDFLADPLSDLRFWAAYRLAQTWQPLPANALAALDETAAYDHTLPQTWGWHVDREALLPLERMYSHPYRLEEAGGDDSDGLPNYAFHLISPAAEYDTFTKQYRRYNPDVFYDSLPEPAVDLRIDPDWLKAQIARAWDGAVFNVREPKPQTYSLDWHMQIDGYHLLGGLHRDGYAVVVTAYDRPSLAFAAWFRSIIAPEHKLYIYEWADTAIELTPGMTATQIDDAYYALDESRRNPPMDNSLHETL